MKRPLTRGQRVIRFIESYCVVPEGTLVGKPVKLSKFQKKFILAIYDNPHVTDTAILSIARKNAKTALIAFIMLANLVGPEAVLNSRIISGAMSKEQAAEVYNLAEKCVQQSPKLSPLIKIQKSKKILIGLVMNVEYQAISADKNTAHGKSPILAILDEVGQVVGPTSDFIDAIITAQGAYEDALVIYISTQAQNDADLLSLLIDDAELNKPKHTICHLYTAPKDCELMDRKAWKLSNPALGVFRSLKDLKKLADKAKRFPSFANKFRNLNLNQRVATNSPFITQETWKLCSKKQVPIEKCTELYGGLDLSSKTDLTAFIIYGLYEGKWNVYSYFWTPEIGLKDRQDKDRAPYVLWVEQGFITTTPGATVSYDWVALKIAEIVKGLDITAIAFDRWRIEILKKELEAIGLELPLVEWGQGFKDMSPALDALEDKILNATLRHGGNPVLTMCAANAMVSHDPAENRKLDKIKTSGRIDGIQALAMATGVAEKPNEKEGDMDDFLNSPIVS